MPREWFVQIGRRIVGPVQATRLRTLAAEGRLQPDSLVSVDGAKWFRANRIQGLTFAGGDESHDVDAAGATAIEVEYTANDNQATWQPMMEEAPTRAATDSAADRHLERSKDPLWRISWIVTAAISVGVVLIGALLLLPSGQH